MMVKEGDDEEDNNECNQTVTQEVRYCAHTSIIIIICCWMVHVEKIFCTMACGGMPITIKIEQLVNQILIPIDGCAVCSGRGDSDTVYWFVNWMVGSGKFQSCRYRCLRCLRWNVTYRKSHYTIL